MYICICNAVTDKQIKKAVNEGCGTFKQVQQQLNVGTCCGKCQSHAKEVILETQSDRHSAEVTSSPATFFPNASLASYL